MAYIAPIHRPSSVRHSIWSHVLSADEQSLVLSKANRLEIWRLNSDGVLTMAHSKIVNGTISMLQKLRPKDTDVDLLFVGTERFQYFTLLWDPETSQLVTNQSFLDPAEHQMREAQSMDRCIVDPSGKFLAMHLWEGVLSMLRLGNRKNNAMKLDWLDNVRLSEIFIRASTFLYTETGHPKVAFLYQTRSDASEYADSKLATYRLTSNDQNTEPSRFEEKDRIIDIDIQGLGAAMLIPVEKMEEEVKRHNVRNIESAKAHVGGLMIVGETKLLYIDEVTQTTVESALKEASIFVAWTEYDITHYFLADDYGNLHLLTILTNGVVVTGMDVSLLGKTSRASNLIYMGDNLLFVASHYGDSQLFRLNLLSDNPLEIMQLVQTMPNISPILDFAIMDMGNRGNESQLGNEYSSGQARIVTGSGIHKDGTLRSVRSGVGLTDLGILADLEHTRALFSLKSNGSQKVDSLAVSFLTETRVFKFDSQGEVEEVLSFSGMAFDSQTLFVKNLPNGQLLQTTPTRVTLTDLESGVVLATWVPEGVRTITNVSANDRWLLLAVEGRGLVSLDLQNDLQVVQETDIGDKDQVACVHVPPSLSDVGVVGFWTSGTVSIVDLFTLQPIHGESLRTSEDDASIPRDLALVQVLPPDVSGPTLFIALDDGNVVTFDISPELTFSGRKRVILGTREARFHLLPQPDGIFIIFATTENPSLIYSSEGRIVYSGITAEDATCVCPFDTEAFPDSIVVATDGEIKIGLIDRQRRTHVWPLKMGEIVRRIAYSPSEKVFGLGCIKRELVDGEEKVESSFKLVDEVIFDKVGKAFPLGTPSYVELVEAVIRADLPDSYGNPAERFIVGTSFLTDPDYGADTKVQGRILVFGIDSDRDPYLIVCHEMRGGVRQLAVMDGKIVSALTKSVVISTYEETSTTTGHLTKIAAYKGPTYPVDIAVHGNIIAVGDLMKSLSLVEYVPGGGDDGGSPKLVERARHFQSAWATSVCHIEDESWLETDSEGNLMILRRNPNGVTLEDKRRMEITSEMNLGEQVNKVRKITVETSPSAMIIPKAFLATTEGGIYLLGTIANHAQDLLLRFQGKMASVIKTTGGIPFNDYRAFRNGERAGDGPFRFLDGELLEKFLDQDEATQREICVGLGPSVEDMRNIVEGLRRLH
ncbi:mono-functional DNA-alkylating methyl methanesulfonate N-term-domain-containing protein [Podospora didyma]|uniref:DNA damage-binding protein 1 n=1 Tax=Podospora didyma TaxID=330526 RepID=A0AAE0NX28_9PEZI|nr:mono-functional DNA-alkylating methyl methanesulfonate N-term-domain-containing protein [Podospora didyma]